MMIFDRRISYPPPPCCIRRGCVLVVVVAMSSSSSSSASSASSALLPATFSDGMFGALLPVVKECEGNIKRVTDSQEELSEHIGKLLNTLSSLKEITKLPPLIPYTEKLMNSRARLKGINTDVAVINDRIETIKELVRTHHAVQQMAQEKGNKQEQGKELLQQQVDTAAAATGSAEDKEKAKEEEEEVKDKTAE